MKAAEAKPASTSSNKTSPFFSRGNGQAFFGNSDPEQAFFGKTNTVSTVQPKLTIGQANDQYEQEADAMAEKVVQRMAELNVVQPKPDALAITPVIQPKLQVPAITPVIQPKCAACETEEKLPKEEDKDLKDTRLQRKPDFDTPDEVPESGKPVQRKCSECEENEKLQAKGGSGNLNASSGFENNLAATKGAGSPLPAATRGPMESSFGADFSNVRIHTDSDSVQMNRALQAQAFTHGSHIYFDHGKYEPSTIKGQKLLAHELTHTIQQGQAGTMIQNAPEDAYITNEIPRSPLVIRVDDKRPVYVPDVAEGQLKGQLDYLSRKKAVEDINAAVRQGFANEGKSTPPTVADENEALINQLGGDLPEARAAIRELIGKGEGGWKSLLHAMNNDNPIVRMMAELALSYNIVKNRELLWFIVEKVENKEVAGALKVAAVRVLYKAGFGAYFDNKAFTQGVIQKLEFIKLFFATIPLPKEGPYEKIVNDWFIKTKKDIWDKADLAIKEFKDEIPLWENLMDIAQVVEIFNTGMAVVSRVIAFMKLFDSHNYTIQNQAVYEVVATATRAIGENLKGILNIRFQDYKTVAHPTASLIDLKYLFKHCESIPKYIATATVNDLSIQLFKVERDSLAVIEALKDKEPPDWAKHVVRLQKVIGITNGIQATLPKISDLAWERPMIYFDIWNQLLSQVGDMMSHMSAINFALNAYSLADVIEESWQVIDKRSDTAQESKAILRKYLKRANELIVENMDNPKKLGEEIEKLREIPE